MEQGAVARLRSLHEIDRDVVELEDGLRRIPVRLKEHEAAVRHLRDLIEAKRNEIVEASARADRRELEIRSREDEIGKLEVARNSVKTNADYDRISIQMESIRADISRLEEEALELISKVDQLRSERTDLEGELVEAESEFRGVAEEIDREAVDLTARREALMERRREATKGIPEEAMSRYDRILRSKGGVAMAPVRNQVCQECNMSVTMHDITRIMKGSDLVLCRTCSRILFLDDNRRY